MPISNGGGGYQIGPGNVDELVSMPIAAPLSLTASATLTPAQLANGFILANSGVTTAQTYTLPTVAALEAAYPNLEKVGSSFRLTLVNLGTSSGTAIIAAGTGWTITGSLTMTVPITTGAAFIARKTAAGAWTLYRVR